MKKYPQKSNTLVLKGIYLDIQLILSGII